METEAPPPTAEAPPKVATPEPAAAEETSKEAAPQQTEEIPQQETHDEGGKSSANESEYDSAGSYSDDEDDPKVRSRRSEDGGSESNSEDGSVGLERESGDGQESVPAKKVDDDEDKKNPQYIPKRGTFYEHDDRTDDVETQDVPEAEKEKEPKKKVWQDKKERWSHDKFNDQDQAPKSRSELVAIYGYDIRNEDGPPRARRRRRYGRGPNKYTRNWEDEDAYNKPAPVTRPKKPPTATNNGSRRTNGRSEEFPPLGYHPDDDDEQIDEKRSGTEDRRSEYTERSEQSPQQHYQENGNRNTQSSSQKQQQVHHHQDRIAQQQQQHHQPSSYYQQQDQQQQRPPQQHQQQNQRVGSGRVINKTNKREIKDSDYKGFTTKTRQGRNIRTEQKIVPKNSGGGGGGLPQKRDDYIETQNFTNKNNSSNMGDVEKEMGKLSLHQQQQQQQEYKGGKHGGGGGGGNQRQGSVPPRLQSEQKGSKRYSSMRQRSLPESQTPPFGQHANYYPNEYNQQGQPQGIIHQTAPPPQIHPSSAQVPQIAPPPLPQIPQVPVTAPPLLQAAPPQFAPAFPAPPQFLQPGVAPPQFIPQQTPQIINYVPSQPQFPPQPYPGYQQQYTQVSFLQTQPTELYQPQTGITYYSTDQQIAQRAVPQKRPKAAIPIVAPPASSPSEYRGKSKEPNEGGESEVPVSVATGAEQSGAAPEYLQQEGTVQQ